MRKYILYAGVNGAGKSTLYMTTHYKDMMPRVNTDEILREFGDWRNTSDLMKAGRIAVERLNSYLSEGITFNHPNPSGVGSSNSWLSSNKAN